MAKPFCTPEMLRPAAQNSVALRVRFDAQKVMTSVTARTTAKTASASSLTPVADGEGGHRSDGSSGAEAVGLAGRGERSLADAGLERAPDAVERRM